MFRNIDIKQDIVEERFFVLYKQLELLQRVDLYSNYHREMKNYISEVAKLFASDRDLDEVRDDHMTRLNRIQKLKNISKYKKDKHTKKLG